MLNEIKTRQLEARKSGDKVAAKLYTTLLGEISPGGGVDKDPQEVVTKFLKNARITERVLNENADRRVFDVQYEITLLESLLPQKMTLAELEEIISALVAEGQTMPQIMKNLKESDKTVDMGQASKVARHYLSK